MARTYYVIAGNHRTYSHEPKHSFEERVFGSYPSKAKAEEIAKALFFTGGYDSVRVAHKNWNTVKGTKVWDKVEERIKSLKGMDKFVRDLKHADYFFWWLSEGLPDEEPEDEIREDAKDNDIFEGIRDTFLDIVNAYIQNEKGDITLPVDLYLF